MLPQAQRIDTGIITIAGKFALDTGARSLTPPPFFRGPTLIQGPHGGFLFGSAVEYPATKTRPADNRAPAPSAARHNTDLLFDERAEYVMWGFSARSATFGAHAGLDRLPGEALKATVLDMMQDWHPRLRALIQAADAATMSVFPVKTSVPIPPWPTRNVTLLGDALHNMTPFGGMGANAALRDAAALHRTLVAVAHGERALLAALSTYEREMVEYGFAAVPGLPCADAAAACRQRPRTGRTEYRPANHRPGPGTPEDGPATLK